MISKQILSLCGNPKTDKKNVEEQVGKIHLSASISSAIPLLELIAVLLG